MSYDNNDIHTAGFVQPVDMPPKPNSELTVNPAMIQNVEKHIKTHKKGYITNSKRQYLQPDKDQKIKTLIIDAFSDFDAGEACFNLFRKYFYRLSTFTYWMLLREVWIAAGHVLSRQPIFYDFFTSSKAKKEALMLPNEQAYLNSLPEMVALYRPMMGEWDGGYAWYPSEGMATEMARRIGAFNVEFRKVPKSMIFAVFMIGNFTQALIIEPEYQAAMKRSVFDFV